jgi:hypothetical protein
VSDVHNTGAAVAVISKRAGDFVLLTTYVQKVDFDRQQVYWRETANQRVVEWKYLHGPSEIGAAYEMRDHGGMSYDPEWPGKDDVRHATKLTGD